MILDKSEYLTCPICRTLNKAEIKHLPINYALLELIDKNLPTKCQVHELELVAYCKDDDLVLCGACIFEHKSHCCFLLTDPSLDALTESKKKQMLDDIEQLTTMKKVWNDQKQELEKLKTRIRDCIEIHKSKIVETEKKMIEDIQEGSRKCLLELTEIGKSEGVQKVSLNVNATLSDLENKVSVLTYKIEKFDELLMAERLKNEVEDKEVFNSLPDLRSIASIHDKLGVKLDYVAAIQNQHLGL